MGDPEGHPSDRNLRSVNITSDFWMADTEVLNGGVAIPTLVLRGTRTGSWSRPEVKRDVGSKRQEPLR